MKRSKLLPHGGALSEAELAGLARQVKATVEFARQVGRVEMTEEAAQAWSAAYEELSAQRAGLVGAIIARAEAHDEIGLIWLLRGRPVVALTETEAAIQGATAVLIYRKLHKPPLGPVGDSLYDVGTLT